MEERLRRHLSKLAYVAGSAAVAFLFAAVAPAAAWPTAHGNPDNTSFADVATAPATKPAAVIGNLGSIVAGAGPVVAPDGTVYIASEQGWVMSFKPDGTAGWRRQIAGNQMIVASPAIGSDGTIYVVGINRPVEGQPPAQQRPGATLHRFNSGGAYLGQTMFPEHGGKGGATTASPNIWRFNGNEMVIVPAVYPGPVGGMIDVRLIGFAPGGGIIVDQTGTANSAETTGGAGIPSVWIPICLLPPIGTLICYIGPSEFSPPGTGLVATMPGVGIYTNPLGGTPWILLSDHNRDLVGLTYAANENKFYENFRKHEANRYMRSAPTILPNNHTIIGFEDIERDLNGTGSAGQSGGIVFSGPNLTKVAPIAGLQEIYASPTRLKDGRVVLMGARGEMTVLDGTTIVHKVKLIDSTIVPAAASRTHFYVSTVSALRSFDATTLAEVGKMDWRNGGMSPPVIGPLGHVYAIAGNQLLVFAPPSAAPAPRGGVFQDSGIPAPVGGGVFQDPGNAVPAGPKTGVFQDSGIPAPTETTSTSQGQPSNGYKPPLSKNGYRLFACLELDGDDCGKKDHREIAKQYCVKEGYSAAQEFDVETRKVKAETLAGDEYCSKKKCKVFEEIVCKM
jgi:hypothetical protein